MTPSRKSLKKYRRVLALCLSIHLSHNDQLIRFYVKFCKLFLRLPQQGCFRKTDKTCRWQTSRITSAYKVAIKSCLYKISLLPSRFKLKDLLLWQQVQNELRRTEQSKIMTNCQQSNPANWVSDVRRMGPCPDYTLTKIQGVVRPDLT